MSDVSLAVSETAFAAVFNRTVPTPSIPFDESTSLGPVWFGLDAAFHIEGAGGVNFESTDTFWLDELRIGWDKLVCRLGFDIPTQEIPRFCILRVPDDVPLVGRVPLGISGRQDLPRCSGHRSADDQPQRHHSFCRHRDQWSLQDRTRQRHECCEDSRAQ